MNEQNAPDTSVFEGTQEELSVIGGEGRKFRAIMDTLPQIVWSTRPDGFHDYYNARWYEFTGVPAGSTDGEGWNGMFHADDQAEAWSHWRHSLATGELYQTEYRLRHRSGAYRWMLGRAQPVRDDHGHITRWYGTCTDIHDTKLAAEYTELLTHELSHRIKNIFAVINGLIGLSSRGRPDVKPFAADLAGRIAALGRAHDFARPHSPQSRPTRHRTTLHAMLTEMMSPYQDGARRRISLHGTDRTIDDQAATPLGLIFHELATNAAKYGSLSVPTGNVIITCTSTGSDCVIVWEESGGPAVGGAPTATGFGTHLTNISVSGHLGGSIKHDWRPTGLIVTLCMPTGSLLRHAPASSLK